MTEQAEIAFSMLQFGAHPNWPGVRAVQEFPNGYSASVIRSPYSYGGEFGLYELAVMSGGSLDYSTPITDDVLGRLSEDEVTAALQQIAALPAKDQTHA